MGEGGEEVAPGQEAMKVCFWCAEELIWTHLEGPSYQETIWLHPDSTKEYDHQVVPVDGKKGYGQFRGEIEAEEGKL